MTAALSTKRHTRPKVKPTIKPTFDSDLAENRIKKNMYVSAIVIIKYVTKAIAFGITETLCHS